MYGTYGSLGGSFVQRRFRNSRNPKRFTTKFLLRFCSLAERVRSCLYQPQTVPMLSRFWSSKTIFS
jgi:hypothetical protein